MQRTRVFAALSGGVDSSVAAALLLQCGYDVVGGMGIMHDDMADGPDAKAARAVADQLGIPFHLIDVRDAFQRHVTKPFCEAYWQGTTPSPCIECNRYVKFGALQDAMGSLGCTMMATGHYARIVPADSTKQEGAQNSNDSHDSDDSGSWDELESRNESDARKNRFETRGPIDTSAHSAKRFELHKAVCLEKDQSYMLAGLSQNQLSHTLFPLGGYAKEEVRALARELGFSNAERRESQDICFIPDGDYARFVEAATGHTAQPGHFVDPAGTVLGTHQGILHYTIGQRKGIGLAFGAPRYVCALDAQTNTVTIGTDDDLLSSAVFVRDFSWISGHAPGGPIRCAAKIRYRQHEQAATAHAQPDGTVELHFDQPQRAVAPGQYAVLYDGTRVLGSGVIAR